MEKGEGFAYSTINQYVGIKQKNVDLNTPKHQGANSKKDVERITVTSHMMQESPLLLYSKI